MNILFSIHLYLPKHQAGGETYCHNMARYFISKGHVVHVLLHESSEYGIDRMYSFEGVDVFPVLRGMNLEPFITWADVIFTHLAFAPWSIQISRLYKKKVYFISHNTHNYDCVSATEYPVGVVYNSNAMKKILNYNRDSFVLHPVTDWRKYDLGKDPEKNEYITLVSLNLNKGGRLFWEIAKAMPERKFLGVLGSYDEQVEGKLPNVKVIPNDPDILNVYRQTRIILMPSQYESWGMVATEAMCNGIPVIYNPTFGLEENVGNAGIRVIREDEITDVELGGSGKGILPIRANVEKWVKAIKSLDNHVFYQRVSNRSRKRSRELDPLKELEEFEKWIT